MTTSWFSEQSRREHVLIRDRQMTEIKRVKKKRKDAAADGRLMM
jgi:hypothetical protein